MMLLTTATAWADTETVSYIDADGKTKTHDATVLTGGGATTLAEGWYVAKGTVTYTGTVTLGGDVTLILEDGCTMNIGSDDENRVDFDGIVPEDGIDENNYPSLTIYGQSLGTGYDKGRLNIYTTGYDNIIVKNLTINGGLTLIPAETLALADNADNTQRIAAAAATGATLTVTLQGRTLYKDGKWNTLCLPFSVALAGSPLDGAEARTLSEASISGTTLNLTFGNPVDELVAGTPYIIKWTRADGYTDDDAHNIVSPAFSGVTVSSGLHPYDTDAVNSDSDPDNNVETDLRVRFLGTYASQAFTEENKSILFLGGGNTLYYPQPAHTDPDDPASPMVYPRIGAQRAYFKIGDGTNAPQLTAFNLNFDGETTGVPPLLSPEGEEGASPRGGLVGGWYTLSGTRLSAKPTQLGLYIHNGLKVMVK